MHVSNRCCELNYVLQYVVAATFLLLCLYILGD